MSKTYISLGRLGDVVNVLPLLYHEHRQGNRCSMMVSSEYASVLAGCSYLDAKVFNGPYWDVDRAFREASGNGEIVVVQTNGPLDVIERLAYNRAGQKQATTDSFVKEQWKLAGKLNLWREQPPLVFDRRNPEREAALVASHVPPQAKTSKRKLLIVSLNGNTAPFPYAELLWELLNLKLTGWRILDLSKVQAEHFYDLLGIYEAADALLCCDSAPLHLSQAVKSLPVLALINDKPNYWHGAPWRPQHVFHCRYQDFAARALEIFDVLKNPRERLAVQETLPPEPVVFRASRSTSNALSEGTWGIHVLIEPGCVGKDSTLIGDEERHPFLRSALQVPLMKARPDDVVLLARPGTKFNREFKTSDAPAYAHRMINGFIHPAVDLFAGTRTFWESIWTEIPDLIMGNDRFWGRVLMEIFKAHGARELRGLIYTEVADKTIRFKRFTDPTPPRLQHNWKIAQPWLAERNTPDTAPSIVNQAQPFPLNLRSLPRHAYNPSVIRGTGSESLWMAYRFHDGERYKTKLGICGVEQSGSITRSKILEIKGVSVEDPRFFWHKKERWLSWVESNWEGQEKPKCVVKIGKLTDDWKIVSESQPNFCKNDWRDMEKNWVFFDVAGTLFSIYTAWGSHVVLDITNETQYTSPGVRWPWGDIKGGVVAGKHEGKLLRFFHSTLDNEDTPWARRYYVGALLMEPQPPFEIVQVSREPILFGSDQDDFSAAERTAIPHYKGRVVFPGGGVRLNNGWLLSVGINDSACALLNVTDLKL